MDVPNAKRWKALCLLCLLSGATLAAQTQARRSGDRTTKPEVAKQPAAKAIGTAQSPAVVQIQPNPQTPDQAAKAARDEERQETDRWWTKALAILTVGVGLLQFIMIAVQSWIAHRQNAIMDVQTSILRDQQAAAASAARSASDGLIETRKSADAAKQAAETAERALALLNRAIINVTDVSIDNRRGESSIPDVVIFTHLEE